MKTSDAQRIPIAQAARLAGVLLFVLILAGPSPALPAGDPPLVIVVAAASPLRDISRATLRRAFLGEPTGGPGGKLIPLNQPLGTPARWQFDKVVLGLEPEAVARFWIDQRIRGLGGSPRAIPPALLIRVVPQLAGAIGYIRANELVPALKALTIDGKAPSDPEYLLR